MRRALVALMIVVVLAVSARHMATAQQHVARGSFRGHAAAQADQPARFSGTVTIDGQRAGTLPGVGAQIGGTNCGSGVVSEGTYTLEVASASAKAGCGTPGATVVFVLLGAGPPGGTRAVETGTWDNTRPQQLDLTFSTRSPAPAMESVPLARGCNNVTVTWPNGAPIETVAAAVRPTEMLVAIWMYVPARQGFFGWSPLPGAPVDLPAVSRLDAVFICMTAPGMLTRPALGAAGAVPPPPPVSTAMTRAECVQQGGVWQRWGLLGREFCQVPAADAGQTCTDGSQCSLGCISRTGCVPGECQRFRTEFGCYSRVRSGRVESALCVD